MSLLDLVHPPVIVRRVEAKPPKPERVRRGSISDEMVLTIRALRELGIMPHLAGRIVGVSHTTVINYWAPQQKRRWHLQPDAKCIRATAKLLGDRALAKRRCA
jgi:hypothetical protein